MSRLPYDFVSLVEPLFTVGATGIEATDVAKEVVREETVIRALSCLWEGLTRGQSATLALAGVITGSL